MEKFKRIPVDTFSKIQTDAGIFLSKFDPTGVIPVAEIDLISATTGGMTATATPSFIDLAEGIDNAPLNIAEMKILDTWKCMMTTTMINGKSVDALKMYCGCATVASNKVTLNPTLKQADFKDIWWVGDTADGGAIAICLKNALNTSGLSFKSTPKGKGEFAVSLEGHVKLATQNEMPMEFYILEPKA